jgi:hypothetical protein
MGYIRENGFNEMLTPLLWVINPVSLKLDWEQIKNSFALY